MSVAWAERKAAARARLTRSVPSVFPASVLIHALGRSLTPHLPRLAIESYWRHHPVRADRIARALARRSTVPEGWTWRLAAAEDDGRPRSFRVPPAPFREAAHRAAPGTCCLCGQPVYRFGWHRDLWGDDRPNGRARWHACCVAAWKLWIAPASQAKLLGRLQKRRCPMTGARLSRAREVDHRVPLHVVWRRDRCRPWAELLGFWGFPNLQAVERNAHIRKSADEAAARAGGRPRLESGVGLATSALVDDGSTHTGASGSRSDPPTEAADVITVSAARRSGTVARGQGA